MLNSFNKDILGRFNYWEQINLTKTNSLVYDFLQKTTELAIDFIYKISNENNFFESFYENEKTFNEKIDLLKPICVFGKPVAYQLEKLWFTNDNNYKPGISGSIKILISIQSS
jgi:hypothetical protein